MKIFLDQFYGALDRLIVTMRNVHDEMDKEIRGKENLPELEQQLTMLRPELNNLDMFMRSEKEHMSIAKQLIGDLIEQGDQK